MKTFLAALMAATAFVAPAAAQPAPAPVNPPAAQPATPPAAAPAPAAAPVCRGRRIDASPAMWVVRDADTTIYLFGTFHLLDACRDWFDDDIRAAFNRSQELVIEADLPEDPAALQPLIVRFAVDADGGSLEGLTATQRTRLAAALTPLGIPEAALDRLDPWFLNVSLSQIAATELGLTSESGAEAVLRRAARERGIPISGLETAEFQFGVLDRQSREEQIEALGESLDDLGQMQRVLRPMLSAWSSGDAARFAGILNESITDDPESYRVLLTDRNATWARFIQDRLTRPGTVFMAVGAGHLGGVASVQEQLSWLGISSSRVRGGRI